MRYDARVEKLERIGLGYVSPLVLWDGPLREDEMTAEQLYRAKHSTAGPFVVVWGQCPGNGYNTDTTEAEL